MTLALGPAPDLDQKLLLLLLINVRATVHVKGYLHVAQASADF